MEYAEAAGFLEPGKKVVIVTGAGNSGSADDKPVITVRQENAPLSGAVPGTAYTHPSSSNCLVSNQAVCVTHELVAKQRQSTRLTSIVCSLGPKYGAVWQPGVPCWEFGRQTRVDSSSRCVALKVLERGANASHAGSGSQRGAA